MFRLACTLIEDAAEAAAAPVAMTPDLVPFPVPDSLGTNPVEIIPFSF